MIFSLENLNLYIFKCDLRIRVKEYPPKHAESRAFNIINPL